MQINIADLRTGDSPENKMVEVHNDYNYENIRFGVRQGSLNLSKIYNIWNDNINTRFRKFLQTHLISGTPDVLAASDLYPIPVIFYKCPDTILFKIRV